MDQDRTPTERRQTTNVLDRIRAYPMIVLMLPLVVAILLCERHGVFYPPEKALYDSLYVHTFILTCEAKNTTQCERYEAKTYGGNVYVYVQRDSTHALPQKGDTIMKLDNIPAGQEDEFNEALKEAQEDTTEAQAPPKEYDTES